MSHGASIVRARRMLPALIVFFSHVSFAVLRARGQEFEGKGESDLQAALLALPSLPERLSPKPNLDLGWIPERPVPARPRSMSHAQRRGWLLLGLAQHGAAFFDARTTRDAMAHFKEFDPLLRPFSHSAAIYPAMQIAPLGLDWLATRLATSRHRWLRRLWWLPQAAATAGFLWSGMHNLELPTPPGIPTH